jgi:membrane fusion protein (multidrug efflux system)
MANESAVTSRERPAPDAAPEGPSTNGQQPGGAQQTPADPRRRTVIGLIVAVLVVIALFYGVRYYQYSKTHVSTDDAYVTGNLVNVSPIISGTLSQLTVDEGDIVKKGQLIARLDDSGEQANLTQAQEAYKAALTQIPQAQTNLAYQQQSTSAAIQKAQAAIATQNAKSNAARAQVSLTQATVRNQVDQAGQQVATAEAQAAQADAQVGAAQQAVRSAQQGVRTAQHAAAAASANVGAARANFNKAQADVQRYQRLLSQQAVTQQQYDVAQAAFLTAQSQLSAAQAQAAQASSQVAQARVAVQQAQAQVVATQRAAAASHRQVDVTRAGLAIAQANNTQVGIQQSNYMSSQTQGSEAAADLANAQAGQKQVQLRRQQIATLQAQAQQAKAALANAQVQENDTYIKAPTDGEVVRKGVNVGAAMTPGQTIITMTAGNDVWVVANFKETQMKGVAPGESAEIEVDAFPGKIFKGKVESINQATGASTALLPPDNATGNFTKVVQRIPVRIKFVAASSGDGSQYATQDDINRLGQGMSVTATIDISR